MDFSPTEWIKFKTSWSVQLVGIEARFRVEPTAHYQRQGRQLWPTFPTPRRAFLLRRIGRTSARRNSIIPQFRPPNSGRSTIEVAVPFRWLFFDCRVEFCSADGRAWGPWRNEFTLRRTREKKKRSATISDKVFALGRPSLMERSSAHQGRGRQPPAPARGRSVHE